jgi:nicotinate-nucleotide adenylyltransferase
LICLFGGTFDPIHHGHLHAARSVCDALKLDRINMLLSARPGHRAEPGASISQRWEMLELACADDPRLVPDATEVRRAERIGRPSYAVETLEEVRERHPEAVLCWVVGSDAFAQLTSWHRWQALFDLTNFLVLRRPGADLTWSGELAAVTAGRLLDDSPGERAGGVLVIEAPMMNVSSTAVRRALAVVGHDSANSGAAAVADLLPAAVYTYIKNHHLYGVFGDA